MESSEKKKISSRIEETEVVTWLKSELASHEKKASKDKLAALFEGIDNHALTLSLEGRLDEILLFANMTILLLIKYAPENQERLIPLCHSLRVHLATAPKCNLSLTVRNNLTTALIHFRNWQLAFTQSRLLAADIEAEIKKNGKLSGALQSLEETGSTGGSIELDSKETKLIVLLLSTYLNLVLGGRSINQSDIIHISSLVQVLQRGYRIAKELLKSADFQKKLKHLLKSLMTIEQSSQSEIISSCPIKITESKVTVNANQQEQDKDDIVKMVCGEKANTQEKEKNKLSYSPFQTRSRSSSKLKNKWDNLHRITSKGGDIRERVNSGDKKMKVSKVKPGNNTPVNRSTANLYMSAKTDNFIVRKTGELKEQLPRKSSTLPSKEEENNSRISKAVPKPSKEYINSIQKVSAGSFNLKITKHQPRSPIKSMTDTGHLKQTQTEDTSSQRMAPSIQMDAKRDPSEDQSDFGTENDRRQIADDKQLPKKSIHCPRKSSLEISKTALRNLMSPHKNKALDGNREVFTEGDNNRRAIKVTRRNDSPQESSSVGISPHSLNSPDYPVPANNQRPRLTEERIHADSSNMSATLKKTGSVDQSRNQQRNLNAGDDKSHDQTLKIGGRERKVRKKLSRLMVYPQLNEADDLGPGPNNVRSFNANTNPFSSQNSADQPNYQTDEINPASRQEFPLRVNVIDNQIYLVEAGESTEAFQTNQRGAAKGLPFSIMSPTSRLGDDGMARSKASVDIRDDPSRDNFTGMANSHMTLNQKDNDTMSYSTSKPTATERLRYLNQGDLVKEYLGLKQKLEEKLDYEGHVERTSQNISEVLGERSFLIKMVDQLLMSNHNLKTQLKLKSGVQVGIDSADLKSGVNSFASENTDENQKALNLEGKRKARTPIKIKQEGTIDAQTIQAQMGRCFQSLYNIHPKSHQEVPRHQTAIMHHKSDLNQEIVVTPTTSKHLDDVCRLTPHSFHHRPGLQSWQDLDIRGHRSSTIVPREVSEMYQQAVGQRDKNKTLIYSQTPLNRNPGKNGLFQDYCSLKPNWLKFRSNFFGDSVRVIKKYVIEGSSDFVCSYIKAKMNQASKELEFEFSTYIVAGNEDSHGMSPMGKASKLQGEQFVYSEGQLAAAIQQCDTTFIDIFPNSSLVNEYACYFLKLFLIRYTTVAVDYKSNSVRTEITQTPNILDTFQSINFLNNQYTVNLIHNSGLSFWLATTSPTVRWPERVKMRVDLTFDRVTFEETFLVTKQLQDCIDENAFRLKLVDLKNITPQIKSMMFNKKFCHNSMYLKNPKTSSPLLAEIVQNAMAVHEKHLRINQKDASGWEFSIKIMNKLYEYAVFEFNDDTSQERVDIQVYYGFSSLCNQSFM